MRARSGRGVLEHSGRHSAARDRAGTPAECWPTSSQALSLSTPARCRSRRPPRSRARPTSAACPTCASRSRATQRPRSVARLPRWCPARSRPGSAVKPVVADLQQRTGIPGSGGGGARHEAGGQRPGGQLRPGHGRGVGPGPQGRARLEPHARHPGAEHAHLSVAQSESRSAQAARFHADHDDTAPSSRTSTSCWRRPAPTLCRCRSPPPRASSCRRSWVQATATRTTRRPSSSPSSCPGCRPTACD